MNKKIRNIIYAIKGWYRSTPNRRMFYIHISDIPKEEAEDNMKKLLKLYHEDIPFPEGVIIKSNNSETWYPNNSIGL